MTLLTKLSMGEGPREWQRSSVILPLTSPLNNGRRMSRGFQHFAEANDVPAAKKVAVFLSVIGATTYGLPRSLLAPDNPGSKPYADLVKILNEHFSPKPIIIAERFRLHKRNQEEGESVAQYLAILKKLSDCDFDTSLHDALHDRENY